MRLWVIYDYMVAGKYSAATGATTNSTCSSCEVGKYAGAPGATSCRICATGKTAAATDCDLCAAGKFEEPGATSCSICQAGKFSSTDGASACTLCAAGKYSPATGAIDVAVCLDCVAGKYSQTTGAADAAACQDCVAGKYLASEGNDASTCVPAPDRAETDGESMCLNTRRVPVLMQPSRRAVWGMMGLFLVQELVSYAIGRAIDHIIDQPATSLFDDDDGASGGDVEQTLACQENLKLDFCNDVIFHSVSKELGKNKNERDMIAKETYDKITQSEVRGGNGSTSMKALTEENAVCKQVVKQSLCLAAFPPCDCRADITACKNNCDLINECARLVKGDKTISICKSCINYCEQFCRTDSESSGSGDTGLDAIGVRRHKNNSLFLALVVFALFVVNK